MVQHCTLPLARTLSVTCLGLLYLLCSTTQAAIYKWTDENGRIHYGDNPPDRDAELIDVDTSVPADTALERRRHKRQRLLETFDEDREEKKAQREKQARDKLQRHENCERARQKLQKIRQASYLKEDTADPRNPRVLSHEERRAVTTASELEVEKWCD